MKRLILYIILGLFISQSALAFGPVDIYRETMAWRGTQNLKPLKLNKCLSLAAQTKLNDMVSKSYFAHLTPDGHDHNLFIQFSGYKAIRTGENLAMGYSNESEIVQNWMNSPTHKSNIVDKSYTDIGVATGKIIWNGKEQNLVVQMFGIASKKNRCK